MVNCTYGHNQQTENSHYHSQHISSEDYFLLSNTIKQPTYSQSHNPNVFVNCFLLLKLYLNCRIFNETRLNRTSICCVIAFCYLSFSFYNNAQEAKRATHFRLRLYILKKMVNYSNYSKTIKIVEMEIGEVMDLLEVLFVKIKLENLSISE